MGENDNTPAVNFDWKIPFLVGTGIAALMLGLSLSLVHLVRGGF